MPNVPGIVRRLVLLGMVMVGLFGLAMNPATARELCNLNGQLALADGNGDGVVSRGEIQAIIDAAQGVEGVEQLQSLLNGLPGDVTGIRYTGCTPDNGGGDGSGTGDGDTGDDESGSGNGDDSGSGTGDDTGNGGTGTGADGSGDGSGTADGSGSGEAGSIVINAEGTPVNSITGLPDTGQMPSAQGPGSGSMWALLGLAGIVAGAGALVMRSRSQAR